MFEGVPRMLLLQLLWSEGVPRMLLLQLYMFFNLLDLSKDVPRMLLLQLILSMGVPTVLPLLTPSVSWIWQRTTPRSSNLIPRLLSPWPGPSSPNETLSYWSCRLLCSKLTTLLAISSK